MPDKAVYLLVVDGFADWEPAHAIAELRRHGHYRIGVAGLSRQPVVVDGGLRILPSMAVTDIDAADVALLILPGGDRWEQAPIEHEIAQLLERIDARAVPVAAICAATVAVARMGRSKWRLLRQQLAHTTVWDVRRLRHLPHLRTDGHTGLSVGEDRWTALAS